MNSFLTKAAVYFSSLTNFRIMFFKLSEIFILTSILRPENLKIKRAILDNTTKIFGIFLISSLYALSIGLYHIASLPINLESDLTGKSFFYIFYSTPFFFIARHFAVFFFVLLLANFLYKASHEDISRIIKVTYWITLSLGLYQITKVGFFEHLGFQLPNIPLLERCYDWYPVCGVYNSGPYQKRILGGAFEPLGYGSTLIMANMLYWYYLKKIPILGFFVLLFAIAKASILGLLAGTFLVLVFRKNYKPIFVSILLTFSALYVCIFYFKDQIYNFLDIESLAIVRGGIVERICTSNASISMFLDNPLGVGLKLWAYYFNVYGECYTIPRSDWLANNDFLQFLAEGGVILLFGFLVYIFNLLRFSSINKKLLVMIIALVIQEFTASLYLDPVFWVTISFVVAEYSKHRQEHLDRHPNPK